MLTIIGGSGFIGTRLCKQLEMQGVNFKIVDIIKSKEYPLNWEFGDVTDPDSLINALKDTSVIINLAAQHKDNVYPTSLYYEVNVNGANNVCNIADMLNIKHIVFTSSVAVYGFIEEETGEDGELRPFNHYGESKKKAEEVYNNWLSNFQDKTLVIIRPTVIFGEGNRGNVFNLFRQIAIGNFIMIGNGDNKKSMAYVENVAAFIRFSLRLSHGKYLFNYIDKPDLSMNELTDVISNSLGKRKSNIRIPYFLGYLVGFSFDILSKLIKKEFPISRIRIKKFCAKTQFKSNYLADTRFKPPVHLEKAISDTVAYEFKEHMKS